MADFDRTYPISGTTTAGETIVIATWAPDAITGEEQWHYQCDLVGLDGRWSRDLLFAGETFGESTWMMLFAGDSECAGQGGGWSSSVWLSLGVP